MPAWKLFNEDVYKMRTGRIPACGKYEISTSNNIFIGHAGFLIFNGESMIKIAEGIVKWRRMMKRSVGTP